MHLKTLGAVSALALFAGVSAGAFAQAPGGGQSGAQERMQTPGQSSGEMAPGQQQKKPSQRGQNQAQEPGQRKGQQAQEPGLRKGQQAEEPGLRKGQQAEEPGQRKGKQAERKQGQEQRQRAEQPESKQKQRAEQPESKQKQRAEQPERKQRQRAEEPTRGKQKQQAQEPTTGKEQQRAGREGSRVQLSEQQRTTVRERIRESGNLDRARVSSVDFNVSVGTKVPRHVHLAPLPTVIVQDVPAYRGYEYFVVRDELVIINPKTYVIVDVIRLDGAQGRAAQAEGRLRLTGDQRQFVLSHIDLQPGIRLGIGGISIGMSVPQTVELRPFPQAVIADVPELEGYRYFVFEQDVAIVDPDQRQVVLTISE